MVFSVDFILCCVFFFFKQKTAYEMRISDWSSDVCSSDLIDRHHLHDSAVFLHHGIETRRAEIGPGRDRCEVIVDMRRHVSSVGLSFMVVIAVRAAAGTVSGRRNPSCRSEEHTSELQSLMRISYAVFCLKKKKNNENRKID